MPGRRSSFKIVFPDAAPTGNGKFINPDPAASSNTIDNELYENLMILMNG